MPPRSPSEVFARGDTVAVMLANTPAMLECHYGVPMCGAVLNALNTRLDPASIAFMLDHGEAKAIIVDREFSGVIGEALKRAKARPLVIDYDDPEYDGPGELLGGLDYEALIVEGDEAYERTAPSDEWDAIALNYTSGTTGDPKGVVYHHRGANLLAAGNILTGDIGRHPVYLWTLPMFHCNGWCFPWSISVKAGVHVCLRQVRAKPIFDLIAEHKVTHMCGAPIVMSILLNATRGREAAAAAYRSFLYRRRPAARRRAQGDGRSRLRGDPSLRPDGGLRAGCGQRLEGRVERA